MESTPRNKNDGVIRRRKYVMVFKQAAILNPPFWFFCILSPSIVFNLITRAFPFFERETRDKNVEGSGDEIELAGHLRVPERVR